MTSGSDAAIGGGKPAYYAIVPGAAGEIAAR